MRSFRLDSTPIHSINLHIRGDAGMMLAENRETRETGKQYPPKWTWYVTEAHREKCVSIALSKKEIEVKNIPEKGGGRKGEKRREKERKKNRKEQACTIGRHYLKWIHPVQFVCLQIYGAEWRSMLAILFLKSLIDVDWSVLQTNLNIAKPLLMRDNHFRKTDAVLGKWNRQCGNEPICFYLLFQFRLVFNSSRYPAQLLLRSAPVPQGCNRLQTNGPMAKHWAPSDFWLQSQPV